MSFFKLNKKIRKLNTITGEVSEIRNTVDTEGGGGKYINISTTQISCFKINGQQIVFKSKTPMMIGNCDRIIVSGRHENGVFVAYAYKNNTTKCFGHADIEQDILMGMLFSTFGFICFFMADHFTVLQVLMSITALFLGLWILYDVKKIISSFNSLKAGRFFFL
jgi:hypothetical protein